MKIVSKPQIVKSADEEIFKFLHLLIYILQIIFDYKILFCSQKGFSKNKPN